MFRGHIKGKTKFEHNIMKKCGCGGIAPPFLISALHGGEWSDSRPNHLYSG
jgi:hypothetical protein